MKKEIQFLTEAHRKNYEKGIVQIEKWQKNPPTLEEALKFQREREK